MRTLPALRAPLPVLTDEVLALTAKLHPVEALARLAPIWAASTPGIAQRALLAARIALMRQAMTVEPVAAIAAGPDPVPVVEPVFIPAPMPKPAPVNRGALTLLNLEDAAKMLMAGADDAEDEPAPAVLRSVPPDLAQAEAEAELAGVIASEAAAVATDAAPVGMPVGVALKARKAKAKRGEGAAVVGAVTPAAMDLAAQFADMAGDAAPVAKVPVLDLAAQFADMAEDAPPVTKVPVLDLAAQFADMAEDAPSVAKAPVLDLAAQFADMAEDAPPVAKAPVLDLAAQFAAMGEGEAEVGPPVRPARKAAPIVVDLSAQFAAMDGE